MSHTAEIVEVKELNDEQVGYRIRCCADDISDSWHSISVLCPTAEDPRTHQQQLEECKARVSVKHEAKIQWRAAQSAAGGPTK